MDKFSLTQILCLFLYYFHLSTISWDDMYIGCGNWKAKCLILGFFFSYLDSLSFLHSVHFDCLMRHLFSYLIYYSVVFQALLNLVLFFIGLFSLFLKLINLIMIRDTLDLRSLDFFYFIFCFIKDIYIYLRFRKSFVTDFEIKDESHILDILSKWVFFRKCSLKLFLIFLFIAFSCFLLPFL